MACRLGLSRTQIDNITENNTAQIQQCQDALITYWRMTTGAAMDKIKKVAHALSQENLSNVAGNE